VSRPRSAALLVFGALALLAAGCGKPVLRVADASLGDYYSAEEYKKLREEQRLEYCEELALQDSIYRDEIAEASAAAARFAARAAAAREAADSLGRAADSLDAAVATVAATRAGAGRRPSRGAAPGDAGGGASVTVRRGDSLWRLSARPSIYGEGRDWKRLFEANRDRIRDADRIYPGQELVVPR
jgi:nucleoid-associated protein YgaU